MIIKSGLIALSPLLFLNPVFYLALAVFGVLELAGIGLDEDPTVGKKGIGGASDDDDMEKEALRRKRRRICQTVLFLTPHTILTDDVWKGKGMAAAAQNDNSIVVGRKGAFASDANATASDIIEAVQGSSADVDVIAPPINLKMGGNRFMFVSNHQLWGLGTLFTMTSIYLTTGIWPRLVLDEFSAQIPLLRNFFCYLGAFHEKFLEKAAATGMPILYYPGGMNEYFRSKRYKPHHCIWENQISFAALAKANGYKVVAVSAIGAESNFWRFFDIPGKYLFSNKGAASSSSSSPSTSSTPSKYTVLPVGLPFPAQKNYLYIGGLIDSNHSKYANDTLHIQLRDDIKKGVQEGVTRAKEYQHADPNRWFVLKFFGFSKI